VSVFNDDYDTAVLIGILLLLMFNSLAIVIPVWYLLDFALVIHECPVRHAYNSMKSPLMHKQSSSTSP
jgi:Na+-translocating ferredoxin:NAD+ oxidoreductase RnfD subunit